MLIGHLPAGYLASLLLDKRQPHGIAYPRLLLCMFAGTLTTALVTALDPQWSVPPVLPWFALLLLSLVGLGAGFSKPLALQAVFFSCGALLASLLAQPGLPSTWLTEPETGRWLVRIELVLLSLAVVGGVLRHRASLLRSTTMALLACITLLMLAVLENTATTDAPQAKPRPADELIDELQQRHPGYRLESLYWLGDTPARVEARLVSDDGQSLLLFLAPDDGAPLAASHAVLWEQQLRWLLGLPRQYPYGSAALLLFGYAAGCLYVLHRRRRQARAQRIELPADTAGHWLIAYASQSGQAEQLARHSAEQLAAAGIASTCVALNALPASELGLARKVLFVVSTYGEGEAPDNARLFAREVLRQPLELGHLQFAMLALGSREYPDFCGFAQALAQWLRQCGAHPLFDPVEVDRQDPGAIRHWQQQLSTLSGHSQFSDWSPAHYRPWRLSRRTRLNPGSQGAAVHHLTLTPQSPHDGWRAGDIAEIRPCNAPASIDAFLERWGLDGDRPVEHAGQAQPLAQVLRQHRLPEQPPTAEQPLAELLASLSPLPHREYSIASLPNSGALELLVRQVRGADGQPGLGSGWLGEHAPLDAQVDLRIRHNPSFHLTEDKRPLILLGNGTGLASLLALLREREQRGESDNWLLFGERNQAHDFLFREQLQRWLECGHLQRLDLAFSRDQAQPVYVQHRLLQAAETLREWLQAGAAIYVCGSLEGMGQGVDDALQQILGLDGLNQLLQQQRYRRDLY